MAGDGSEPAQVWRKREGWKLAQWLYHLPDKQALNLHSRFHLSTCVVDLFFLLASLLQSVPGLYARRASSTLSSSSLPAPPSPPLLLLKGTLFDSGGDDRRQARTKAGKGVGVVPVSYKLFLLGAMLQQHRQFFTNWVAIISVSAHCHYHCRCLCRWNNKEANDQGHNYTRAGQSAASSFHLLTDARPRQA